MRSHLDHHQSYRSPHPLSGIGRSQARVLDLPKLSIARGPDFFGNWREFRANFRNGQTRSPMDAELWLRVVISFEPRTASPLAAVFGGQSTFRLARVATAVGLAARLLIETTSDP